MELAIIQTGGKQYIVKVGDTIKIEKIIPAAGTELSVGSKISFNEVILKDDGAAAILGAPFIQNGSVAGVITEIGRSKKVITAKYKAKVRYRNKKGHRQPFMKVRIEEIK